MQIQIIIEKFLRNAKSHEYKLKPIDRLLLFIIASYMGKKTTCHPGYSALMRDLGINDRTALSDSLQKLVNTNLLSYQKRIGQSNVYTFNLELLNQFLPVGKAYQGSRESLLPPVGNPYSNNAFNNINNNKGYYDKNKAKTELHSTVPDYIPIKLEPPKLTPVGKAHLDTMKKRLR